MPWARIFVIDNNYSSKSTNITNLMKGNENVCFFNLDISKAEIIKDFSKLTGNMKIHHIYHLASPPIYQKDPINTIMNLSSEF